MKWTSIAAIFALFWVMGCFVALSFGVRTADEAGVEKVPGQAESAPAYFEPRKVLLRGTVLAVVLFGLYYANWTFGWITPEDIDVLQRLR
jgi:predicted secreted protein